MQLTGSIIVQCCNCISAFAELVESFFFGHMFKTYSEGDKLAEYHATPEKPQ